MPQGAAKLQAVKVLVLEKLKAGLLWLKTLTQKWLIYKEMGKITSFFAKHCMYQNLNR